MFFTTIKGLIAHKLRMFATALAVTLGVAFMAGTLVLTDTVGKTFDDLFGNVYKQTDVVVRGQAVFDAVTHEADMRHALARPGERTCDGVAISFEFCCLGRTAGGLPALRVVTERGETIAGTGDPIATLTTSQFEFIRASSGRRSAAEIAAYEWQGQIDPEALLIAPFFRMRPVPLDE